MAIWGRGQDRAQDRIPDKGHSSCEYRGQDKTDDKTGEREND